MSEYGYNYGMWAANGAVDAHTIMAARDLEGWVTVSLFNDADGQLWVVSRKPMTEWERDQAMREKYKNDKTIVDRRSK